MTVSIHIAPESDRGQNSEEASRPRVPEPGRGRLREQLPSRARQRRRLPRTDVAVADRRQARLCRGPTV